MKKVIVALICLVFFLVFAFAVLYSFFRAEKALSNHMEKIIDGYHVQIKERDSLIDAYAAVWESKDSLLRMKDKVLSYYEKRHPLDGKDTDLKKYMSTLIILAKSIEYKDSLLEVWAPDSIAPYRLKHLPIN